ncbi:DsbA family oxidoreductase [Streptomyces chromofuscus]|uniref:DsbA family oxidoreductase n=1 Tax=Streptomyces chromofuscus TaxID=42881 RepID=A0A7M2T5R3_STRCW|nr:DsbA family oxidoreductase [Streptomyces chromofuscus]QOV42811.1 DsbA family oxidoreductase [Streptomyces chromofuscus]GGS91101.1 protein disulfide-isomerase [Streptomyces chromofuscus]
MKVEIWSDLTCPWCGLAGHRLDRAVERFAHGGDVELIHRSFPLDPDLPSSPAVPTRQALKQKYGMDDAQAEAATRRVEVLAEREGLRPYIVLDNKKAGTQLAHEFLAHATAQGKHAEAWRLTFRAYFGEAHSLFDVDALLELSDELGLDREETRQVLVERRFRQQVRDEARRAGTLGARGVPFLVIDGQYAVAGAQDTETFLDVFQQVWDATHPQLVQTPDGDADGVCGPDGCVLPGDHAARA